MIKCFRCGSESCRSSLYFISTEASYRTTSLIGAAELGLCPDCISTGYKKLGKKPAVTMILWLVLSFAALFASSKLGTGAPPYIKIICVIVSIFGLYNGIRDLIVVSVYRKRRKDIRTFIPEMNQTDFNEQVNTHLAETEKINDGIIFNYRELADGDNRKSPLELDINAKRVTRRIKEEDISEVPANLTDCGHELDRDTCEKIHKAILDYFE